MVCSPPVAGVTLSSSWSINPWSINSLIIEIPPSIRIFSPKSPRAFSIAWVGEQFQNIAKWFPWTGLTKDLEITTRGTGVRLYGSCRAVFPPTIMTSTSLRLCRKALRSSGELTPADLLSLEVEPSAPTTNVATTLTATSIA